MKKLIVAMALVAGVAAHATSFSYQGALRNADGSAITDLTKKIIFRIYETPDGGNALWVGQQTVAISPTNGLFNVEIGDSTPSYDAEMKMGNRPLLDEVLARSTDLYIGLDVYDTPNGLSGEIRPRQRILPVPTATYARNAREAKGDFTVMSNLVVKGAMNVTSSVTFNTNATFAGAVEIDAKATFKGDAAISGTLSAMAGNKVVEVMPVPIGGIIMWSQTGAPNGEAWATGAKDEKGHWAICNGQKIGDVQTPDLRGRFIVGASGKKDEKGEGVDIAYAAGETGGTNAVSLKTSEMPAHFHLYPGDEDWMYLFKGGDRFGKWGENEMRYRLGRTYLHNGDIGQHPDFDMDGKGSNKLRILETGRTGGDGTKTTSEDSEGEGYAALDHAAAHENRPPYYALFYIMRVR